MCNETRKSKYAHTKNRCGYQMKLPKRNRIKKTPKYTQYTKITDDDYSNDDEDDEKVDRDTVIENEEEENREYEEIPCVCSWDMPNCGRQKSKAYIFREKVCVFSGNEQK